MNRVGNELAVCDPDNYTTYRDGSGWVNLSVLPKLCHPGPPPQVDKVDANFAIKLELRSNAHSLGAQVIENIKVEE